MWARLVLEASQARDSARLTFVALSLVADRNKVAAVSVPQLAIWAKVTERQVQYDLRALQTLGELELVEKGGGRGRPAKYRILLRWKRAKG